jgi:hypothetical protein
MIKTIPDAAVQVTPSNTNYITDIEGNRTFGSLYIGTSGDLVVLPFTHDDTNNASTTGVGGAIIFTNVPVGFFPLKVKKVFSTGTTASGIICQFDN